jgi:heme-degrading monooxygenase HmoA
MPTLKLYYSGTLEILNIAHCPNKFFKMKEPYYAVIFTSLQTDQSEGYSEMAVAMENLAKLQLGFLGVESAREDVGITISYWETTNDIKNWRANLDHLMAQKLGKYQWYRSYKVRICKVEREYEFRND